MLLTHIFHLDGHERAVFERLFHNEPGVVCVYMELYYLLVVDKYRAVAYLADEFVKFSGSTLANERLGFFNYALGAVCELDVFTTKFGKYGISALEGRIYRQDRMLLKRREHSLKNYHESVAACVYKVDLLEDGELVGGSCQSLLSRLYHTNEEA